MNHYSKFRNSSIGSSLLLQVRQHDPSAWSRVVQVYGPVVYRWCRNAGIPDHAAADVGQEVFRAVATGIGKFRREKSGDTFVGWMRQITRFKIADYQRVAMSEPVAAGGSAFLGVLGSLEDPVGGQNGGDAETAAAEIKPLDEERLILVARMLEVMEGSFQPNTWKAFWATAVENRKAKDVALDLNMTAMAVRKAKSRVLRRLRDEFGGLVSPESSN